jgi:hypothetical protein
MLGKNCHAAWACLLCGISIFVVATLASAGQPESQYKSQSSAQEIPIHLPTAQSVEATLTGLFGSPAVFQGFGPCRIVDTRGSTGTYGGPSLTTTARDFPLEGTTGYSCSNSTPSSGIVAYSLYITIVSPASQGYLSVWPKGQSAPGTSVLNFDAGETIGSAAIVAAGTDGKITVAPSCTADVIIDISGVFLSSSSVSSSDPGLSITNTGSNFALYGVGGAGGVYGQTNGSGVGQPGVYGSGTASAPGVRGDGYDSYGVYATSAHYAAIYCNGDFVATGTKSFVEPYPTDPTKVIRYISLEGPEAGTYFRGTGRTIRGKYVIKVPEDFRIVTDASGLTVQLTPIGDLATMAVVKEGLNHIVVRSSKDVAFHYQVNGVRRAFKDRQPVTFGGDFVPNSATARLPENLPSEIRERLVRNGTYNEDGTVNSETALRLGWIRLWTGKENFNLASVVRSPEQPADRQARQTREEITTQHR